MDGLKESTVSRHVAELLAETGAIKAEVDQDKLPTFLANMAEVTTFFQDGQHDNLITLAIDNDDAGHTFIERLTAKGVGLTQDLPPIVEGRDKTDWNDYLKMTKEGTQKALDRSHQGQDVSEQQKKERTNVSSGSLQPKAEGSSTPVLETSTFERSVTSRPTVSSHLLKFTISEDFQSRDFFKKSKKYISEKELNKLNRRANIIQQAAQYYRDELANSTISYFLSNGLYQSFLVVYYFLKL